MGWNRTTITDFGFEVVSHTKRIKGECPMCGTVFDKEFDLQAGDYSYKCPCGYFHFNAEDEILTEDSHNIPQENWKQRLAKKIVEDGLKQIPPEELKRLIAEWAQKQEAESAS